MSLLAYEIKQRALFDAIRFCGSVRKYSKLIGATRTQVSNWVNDPSIKIDYRYAVLTEAKTCVSVDRLSPNTPEVNQYIRSWRSKAYDVFQLPLDDITIEAGFNDYYRSNMTHWFRKQPILISQNKTLITGYSRWLTDKKQNKRHITATIIDVEALCLRIHTLVELHQNLSITHRACVGAYLELILSSHYQGKRPHLITLASNQSYYDHTATRMYGLSQKQISNCVGFGNQESYRQAKSVARHGISKLIMAMNDKHIAIHTAAHIAKHPPKQQRQLLAEKIACV